MDWKNVPVNWDLSLLYAGLDDQRIAGDTKLYEEAISTFVRKWQKDKSFLKNSSSLLTALDELESLFSEYGELKPAYFFYLHLYLAQDNAELKGKLEQLAEVERSAMNKIRFFFLELGKVDQTTQQKFLADKNLQKYKHYLERTFATAKYDLSDAEERVIMELSKPASGSWHQMRETLLSAEAIDFNHPEKGFQKLSYGEVLDLCSDTNKTVRDLAAVEVHKLVTKFAPIMEHELNAILQTKKASDKLRGYEFPAQSRHIADDIETNVVEALQKAVTDNFQIAREYYELKAKLLKQDKLAYHERNVPIELGAELKEYSYPAALELVHDTFYELDPDFAAHVASFASQGRIDAFPRLNKHDNAFCIHGAKNQPVFILLGHNNRLQDVLTLAHELGHGINFEYIRKAQNALHYSSPTSTAEVASTFMEDFVLERLLKDATPQQQLEIHMAKLNDDISTIIRQIACYNFEIELHDEFRKLGYLSKEQIGEIFKKHMSAYMGEFVTQDEGSQNWWVYWGHIRNYFYNYSYASGLLISKALQAKVREDKESINLVKQFLAAGSSASPASIFKEIGIDISKSEFWTAGLLEIKHGLDRAIELATQLKIL